MKCPRCKTGTPVVSEKEGGTHVKCDTCGGGLLVFSGNPLESWLRSMKVRANPPKPEEE